MTENPRRRPSPSSTAAAAVAGVGSAVLATTGGAAPTGLAVVDALLLGSIGLALASCGRRARAVPLVLAALSVCAVQTELSALALGAVALGLGLVRGGGRGRSWMGAASAGLTWAAVVGAPFQPAAKFTVVPLVGCAVIVWSARSGARRRFRRRFDRVAIVAAVGLGLVCVGGGLAAAAARPHLDRGADLLSSGLDAGRDGDAAAAADDLAAAARALGQGRDALDAPWARLTWVIPGVSQHARVARDVVATSAELAAVAADAARDADVDALTVSDGAVDVSAIEAMRDPLAAVVSELRRTADVIASTEGQWLIGPLRDQLDEAASDLGEALPRAELALSGIEVAPDLLGAGEPARYLVLFTTPVEARATTGFPGNFAELTFTEGRFEMTRFGRIAELNDSLPDGGADLDGVSTDFLQRYGRFQPEHDWRSIVLSPDFPTVAEVGRRLWEAGGGAPLTGMLTLDPTALAALLRYTGPIELPEIGQVLDADNAVQFLHLDQYVSYPDTPNRIDALELLAGTAFDRLLRADLPGPRALGDQFGPIVEDGHLQLTTFDDDSAEFLDRIGITGAYPDVDGDFLGVTSTNSSGSKIDIFARREIGYDVSWNPVTGEIDAVATITVRNQAPATGLPDYVIGNALTTQLGDDAPPDGWNRTYLTLYTPWQWTTATLDGAPVNLQQNVELGRFALSTSLLIPPGGEATLRVTLAGALSGRYRLDLATQPQVEPDEASIRIDVDGSEVLRASGPVVAEGSSATGRFLLERPTRMMLTLG